MPDRITVERDGPRVVITLHLADAYAAMVLCDQIVAPERHGEPVRLTVRVQEVVDA